MRFVSAESAGTSFAALIEGERLIPIRGVDELGRGATTAQLTDPDLDHAGTVRLDEARLRPVIPSPGKIICLGLNYCSHANEAGRELPTYPVLFTKFVESLVGPYDEVLLPPETAAGDFEAEMAIVIGTPVRRVQPENALAAVAGVTVANDVTMRDFQRRTPQWLQGKSWEATTPLGPALVTLDEVDLAGGLDISLTLNGDELQRGNTASMIFDVPTIVALLSEFVTLQPGDVILTGTPEGVGDFREPPVRLKEGDVLCTEVVGVGRLENRVVSES